MPDIKAKHNQIVQQSKHATQANSPDGRKSAIPAHDPNQSLNKKIAWNFKRMDDEGEWCCLWDSLGEFLNKLCAFEGRSIGDIFFKGGNHSHPVAVSRVCQKAQNRLESLGIGDETLFQIKLDHLARLWGVKEENIFHIIWLDRSHTVYPTNHR